jgi:hypothetical protein
MTIPHDHHGPGIELERSLPSEVSAISPFVDKLMLLFRKCGCVPQSDSDVEIALREASQTRSFTEIMRIPENTSMFVAAVTPMNSQSL